MRRQVHVFDPITGADGATDPLLLARSLNLLQDGDELHATIDAFSMLLLTAEWSSRVLWSETSLVDQPTNAWNSLEGETETLNSDSWRFLRPITSRDAYFHCRKTGLYQLDALFEAKIGSLPLSPTLDPQVTKMEFAYTIFRDPSTKTDYLLHEECQPGQPHRIKLGSNCAGRRYTGVIMEDLYLKCVSITGADLVPLYRNDLVYFYWKATSTELGINIDEISLRASFQKTGDIFRKPKLVRYVKPHYYTYLDVTAYSSGISSTSATPDII